MRSVVAFTAALVLAGCGHECAVQAVPAWAKVSPDQIAAAKKAGVPVAFESPIGMRFVLIPAGTFTMGSPETEESRDDGPVEVAHQVTLTRAYYLGITEVTNRQYRRFRPDHDSGEQVGHSLRGDEQPVVDVSWDEATSFVAWLTAGDPGQTYRLPTEAEWERACRAGTSTPFWWGTSANTDQANYDGNYIYGGGPKGLDRKTTVSVGTLPASPWGLYEIHGNVREWCADWYDPEGYPAGPLTDPAGPTSGESRVVRGGSWGEASYNMRSACRFWIGPGETRSYIGFRVAVSVPAR